MRLRDICREAYRALALAGCARRQSRPPYAERYGQVPRLGSCRRPARSTCVPSRGKSESPWCNAADAAGAALLVCSAASEQT